MCDRCKIIKTAFGLRDPLPPRVASLDADLPTLTNIVPYAKADDDQIHSAKKDTDLSPPVQDDSYRVPQAADNDAITQLCLPDGVLPTEAFNEPSKILPLVLRNNTPAQSTYTTGDSSGASTAGSPICPKWSDVAAFGSEAVQPPSSTDAPNNPIPATRSVLALIMEHEDILDILMLNCPDFPTLLALVASCKTAKRAFEQHPQGIIKAMLDTMPQELQYLTVALIGINGSNIPTSKSVKKNMEIWLGKRRKPLGRRLQTGPIETVRKLARTFSAIDLFMKVIPKNCENNFADYKTVLASRVGLDYSYVTDTSNKHPLLQQTEWSDVPDDTEWDVPRLPPGAGPQAISSALNDREIYRLKRSLLRYELFCALFYLGPDKYYDKQNSPLRFRPAPKFCRGHAFCKAQRVFLRDYVNPWEIGELAVVSQFMYDLVRNAYFHKYMNLRYLDACDSLYGPYGNKNHGRNRHFDHEEAAEEFDNHTVWFASQGLTLLKKIYIDRHLGYNALVEKHCPPRYRPAELFIPVEKCAEQQWYDISDPKDSWKPRHTWSDTVGMELPSKSWLAKGPTSDSNGHEEAYWGEKWMRKIGYYIWDRD